MCIRDRFYDKLTTLIRHSCDCDGANKPAVNTISSKSETTEEDMTMHRSSNDAEEIDSNRDDFKGVELNRGEGEEVTDKTVEVKKGERLKSEPAQDEKTSRWSRDRSTVAPSVSHIYSNDTAMEVLQHLHLARSRCDVFHGRQDCLRAVLDYVSGPSRLPMIIHGCSGCGKTSVMAKVVESVALWAKSAAKKMASKQVKHVVTIVRFLGTTAMTSNVRDLLESLCRQLTVIYTSRSILLHFFHAIYGVRSRIWEGGLSEGLDNEDTSWAPGTMPWERIYELKCRKIS